MYLAEFMERKEMLEDVRICNGRSFAQRISGQAGEGART